jgi:ribbon-helix-helix CopG family protein
MPDNSRDAENKENKSVDTAYPIGSQCYAMAKTSKPEKLAMRPTEDDYALVTKLRKKLGVDSSQIIRLALRKLAEAEGL